MDSQKSAPLLGVLLVLLAVALLSAMDASVKLLLDGGISALQMLALRSWLVVPLLLGWAWRRGGGPAAITTKRWKLHFLRVAIGTGSPLFFFTAIKTLPLADATTIFFGSSFIMTGLSVVMLKERVGPHRWSAVVGGFIGVVIAMRPSLDMDIGALYALAASISYSFFILMTRVLGSGEGSLKQVIYFHAWLGLVGSVSLPFVYSPFSLRDVELIIIIGILVVTGHLSMTKAYSIAPVALLVPFGYTAMIWSALLGYAFWDHVPGVEVLVGGAVIVLSGLYLTYRETLAARRERQRDRAEKAEAAAAADGPVAVITPGAAHDARGQGDETA